MTILAIAQSCAVRLQLPSPSTLVGNSDGNLMLLRAMIEDAAQAIRNAYTWPELHREYTFTLATSTAAYAMPGDFHRLLPESLWNRTETYPLMGPLNAQEWQRYKSGLIASAPRQRFRLKYWATLQFFLDPTPTSDANGQTCAFEYITKTCFRPKTWAASTAFGANSYCSYNGNIYQTLTAGGTTGATPPTHTSGGVFDGAVTWTYVSTFYDTIIADTDEFLLDTDMLIDGAIWRWKRERKYEYAELKAEAESAIELAKTNLEGSSVLTINQGRQSPPLLGPWSYPEMDYGS